ncbi:MAG: TetR/AcrR family transcriptional regulator [Deltaproteobacteria bacterium]|jgi:AcrR family transcriptional regulator|nr:TetR/AcrR family transcriptional regulator [Deltaproteobacteria bacterium]
MHSIEKRRPGRPPNGGKSEEPKLKDKILKESILVLSERGIPNFSLKEVSRRAQITPAAIYYYFGNKKALIYAALDNYLLPLMQTFFTAMGDKDKDPEETVLGLQDAILTAAKNAPWFLALWSRDISSVNATLPSYLKARIDTNDLFRFIDKIRQGQKDKTINIGIVPEMAYISVIATTLLPLVIQPTWEKFFNFNIEPQSMERHVKTIARNGFLTRAPLAPDESDTRHKKTPKANS